MNTGRPSPLRNASDKFLDFFTDHHQQIGELINDNHNIWHLTQSWCVFRLPLFKGAIKRVGNRFTFLDRRKHFAVIANDIPDPERGHQPEAAVHLDDAPAQGIGGFLHVGYHRCQQVRDTVVCREF